MTPPVLFRGRWYNREGFLFQNRHFSHVSALPFAAEVTAPGPLDASDAHTRAEQSGEHRRACPRAQGRSAGGGQEQSDARELQKGRTILCSLSKERPARLWCKFDRRQHGRCERCSRDTGVAKRLGVYCTIPCKVLCVPPCNALTCCIALLLTCSQPWLGAGPLGRA